MLQTSQSVSTGATKAYVGCRTTAERQARGAGIEVFDVAADGQWRHLQRVPAGDNPSFLVVDDERRAVYCVHGDGSTVISFEMDSAGLLQPKDTQSTEGRNPVHLAISPGRRWLVVANYATGSVVTLPIQANGGLGPVECLLALPDAPGPHRTQQRGAHPHQVVFDPTGRWLLVPDKGADAIHTLRLDETSGAVTLVRTLKAAPMSGPRHLTFRPDDAMAWTVFELSSEVMAARFDAATGTLLPVARTSTIPDSFMDENTGAGIVLSPDGRRLHVSNRGHGSVVRFEVAPDSGLLSQPMWAQTGGRSPRFIGPGPHGGVLIANEDADTVMHLGEHTSQASKMAATGSPVCIATHFNATTRGTT